MRRESTGVWPLIGKMRLINHTEGRSSGDRILSEPPAAAAAAGPGVSGTPSRREDARFYFFFLTTCGTHFSSLQLILRAFVVFFFLFLRLSSWFKSGSAAVPCQSSQSHSVA